MRATATYKLLVLSLIYLFVITISVYVLLLLAASFREKRRTFRKGELDHEHMIWVLSLFVICFPVLHNVEETEVGLTGNLFTELYRNYTRIPPLWPNWPLGFLVGCHILTKHIYLWMQNLFTQTGKKIRFCFSRQMSLYTFLLWYKLTRFKKLYLLIAV